jgi:hypothetical protein
MLQKKYKKAIEDYEGFNIPTEIYNFVEFFEVTVNTLFTVKRIIVMKSITLILMMNQSFILTLV